MTQVPDSRVGMLLLMPVPLAGTADPGDCIPEGLRLHICQTHHFVVENAKTARKIIRALGHPQALAQLQLTELNEHTPPDKVEILLEPLLAGHDVGLMSEAGCPAIADPGALLVKKAHEKGIRVRPLTGPSSLILGLMASGLEGQRFAFSGYVSADAGERRKRLQQLEQRSRQEDETQLVIETPYRNDVFLAALLETLAPTTRLCIARDLTGNNEWVVTRTIAEWHKRPPPPLKGLPVLFLFQVSPR